MMLQRSPDFEGMFHLYADVRRGPVYSNYRPQHAIHDNYQTSGHHNYLDRACVQPGDIARVEVWLITPQFYPQCLWEGREIKVLEGAKHVGNLLVRQVFNEVLRVRPQDYRPVWVKPSGLDSVG